LLPSNRKSYLGTYIVQLIGTDSGPFAVTVSNLASDGAILGTKTWTGTATLNEQMSSTFTTNSDGSILTSELFVVPEYIVPIGAVCTCFLASAIFNKRQKILSRTTVA
jgi:hypothetical protein